MRKRFLLLLMLLLSIFTLVACSNTGNGGGGGTPEPTPNPERPAESLGFTIHYQRPGADYARWGLWLWEDGKDGSLYEFNGEDSFGVYFKASWDEWGSNAVENSKLGFIVRDLSDWIKE